MPWTRATSSSNDYVLKIKSEGNSCQAEFLLRDKVVYSLRIPAAPKNFEISTFQLKDM